MKMCRAIVWLLLLGCTYAQTQGGPPKPAPEHGIDHPAPNAAAQPPKIDPAKAADIRQLMDVAEVTSLMSQMMETMGDNIKPAMTNALPTGDYREKLIDLFIAKFKSKADMQQLLNLIAPLYDKYLSDEEIKGLIQFYQTPLGKKTVKVMPQVMVEAQQAGRKWGEALGRQSMIDVLSEHPELEKAMEDANKTSQLQ